MSEFLFELLVEDMPPSHQGVARDFLRKKIEEFMEEKRFSFEKIEVYTTRCRITLLISGKLQAPGSEELIVGPPVRMAFDKEGNPTPAAIGFAKRVGKEVSELERVEKEKGEYLGVRIKKEPPEFQKVFPPYLTEILYKIPFPKTMRWDGWRFSRRVRNVLASFNGEDVDMEAFGMRATRITRGHRIFSPIFVQVSDAPSYFEGLKSAFVVVKNGEREEMILKGLEEKAGGKFPPVRVIEYWRDSVEFPNVFVGSFPEKYLELPKEIIISSLEEEMGLFLLEGEAPNRFAGVADNPNEDLSKVVAGNERVAKARLEDALYFWRRDREKSLEELREELRNVLYNDVLGSYYEKTKRLEALAEEVMGMVPGVDPALKDAAALCKSDLVTELVGEFPALQGIAGGLILKYQGREEALWRAVYDHYRPAGAEDELPHTLEGKLLSLIDKIDHLVVAFATGYKPSGSGDPLGVRRAALGIIRLITEGDVGVKLEALLEKSFALVAKEITLVASLQDDIREFILKRSEQKLVSEGFPPVHVREVLAKEGLNLKRALGKLEALNRLRQTEALSVLVQTHRRIKNITSSQDEKTLNPQFLTTPYEKNLLEILETVEEAVKGFEEHGDYLSVLDGLLQVAPFVDDLFENLMIMDSDPQVRDNRIALLQRAERLLSGFMDFTKLQEG